LAIGGIQVETFDAIKGRRRRTPDCQTDTWPMPELADNLGGAINLATAGDVARLQSTI